MKKRNLLIAAGCAAALLATAVITGSLCHAAPGQARAIYAPGCPSVAPEAFEAETFVTFVDEPRTANVFDQSLLPEDYTTCYRESWEGAHLKITRPYDKSSYPLNMGTPDVRWDDLTDNVWMVIVKAPGWQEPVSVITDKKTWRPDEALWERVKKSGTGEWVSLEVRGCRVADGRRVDNAVYSDSVTFRVSTWPADPVIVYRLVTPLFHTYKAPDMYYQNIATLEQRVFYEGMGCYCTNCHSFPNSPSTADSDYDMALAVRRRLGTERYSILGLYNFAGRTGKSVNVNSFFMSWNPDGTKLAACVGKDSYSKPLITLETQEFLVRMADIRIIDRETGKDTPLPGADTVDFMETFPAWSTDGKTILYTRAEEIGDNWHPLKFSIHSVPYNDGKGGVATPLPGASNNGKSSFFPRFSPDGKWMVWTVAEWSSLVAPTSDLWIMSAGDWSDPRELECNVDYAMDSHHSWSSNSRWLVFTSKRDDGIFTRMYMTEIDDSGHASPPVEVPTPGGDEVMCYNVPEFMKFDFPIDSGDLMRQTSAAPWKNAAAAAKPAGEPARAAR